MRGRHCASAGRSGCESLADGAIAGTAAARELARPDRPLERPAALGRDRPRQRLDAAATEPAVAIERGRGQASFPLAVNYSAEQPRCRSSPGARWDSWTFGMAEDRRFFQLAALTKRSHLGLRDRHRTPDRKGGLLECTPAQQKRRNQFLANHIAAEMAYRRGKPLERSHWQPSDSPGSPLAHNRLLEDCRAFDFAFPMHPQRCERRKLRLAPSTLAYSIVSNHSSARRGTRELRRRRGRSQSPSTNADAFSDFCERKTQTIRHQRHW